MSELTKEEILTWIDATLNGWEKSEMTHAKKLSNPGLVQAIKKDIEYLKIIRKLIEQGKPIEIIENLIKAFASLMDELSQTKATDWGIVNDALLAGEKYLRTNKINKAGIGVSDEEER